MKSYIGIMALIGLVALAGCGLSKEGGKGAAAPVDDWVREFGLDQRELASTGRNPYFILEPNFQLALEGAGGRLVITVLEETERVGEVETRVVEEREWQDGVLVEVSRNYFAIDTASHDLFYFGEAVDDYQEDQIVGHGGSWRAGEAGAQAGMLMPGAATLGMKYYQEIAPGVAMDRAEIVAVGKVCTVPAGIFGRCLKTEEGSGLNPDEKEFKHYALGVGLIQEGDLRLVKYGFIQKQPGKPVESNRQ